MAECATEHHDVADHLEQAPKSGGFAPHCRRLDFSVDLPPRLRGGAEAQHDDVDRAHDDERYLYISRGITNPIGKDDLTCLDVRHTVSHRCMS